jgi:hypothetical protein
MSEMLGTRHARLYKMCRHYAVSGGDMNMVANKLEVLKALFFGERVAEEESVELGRYFVQTDQWRQLYAGQADVVYGLKGSGKSALYSSLLNHRDELEDRGIRLIAGENPRGTPVFRDLVDDPPTTEQEFRNLWKLYFLQLIGQNFRDRVVESDEADQFVARMEESGLLPKAGGLKAFVRSALDYVRYFTKPEGVETNLKLDSSTGMPTGITGKILFREPNAAAQRAGAVSVDALFGLANKALSDTERAVWILLDRLDVAFAENIDLEQNALRALFVVYADLRIYEKITPKIFLRSDIWERITRAGFREASHITKAITISWNDPSLMNLIMRRVLQAEEIALFYDVIPVQILGDLAKQNDLFYRVFPQQVEVGSRRPTTFDWIRTRTQDGTRHTAPRELIHLLSEARTVQLKKLEIGEGVPEGQQLITGDALKQALEEVSRVRLQQTMLAEFPSLRDYILKLRGAKTQQSVASLREIWKEDLSRVVDTATALVDVGFFERRGSRDEPEFWVPFLYRDALNMIQGAAE